MPAMRAPAGLLRRLAACFYDTLLLIALWMFAAALWLPFTGGEAVPPQWYPLFKAYLLAVALLFFVGFWLRSGQTLGMQAWKVQVQASGDVALRPQQALIRFAAAAVGWLLLAAGVWALLEKHMFIATLCWAALAASLLWALIDERKRTWYDIAAGTELVWLR